MIDEHQENYLEITKTIMKLVDFTGNEEQTTEQYLFKMFSNINKIADTSSTTDVLSKVIFMSLRDVASDLEEILNLKSDANFEKYSNIREKLSMYLQFLKPNKNRPSISIRKYIHEHNYGILFVSNFNNANAEKLSDLIVEAHYPSDALCLFSSRKAFKVARNSIIDGCRLQTLPEAKSSIFCSTKNDVYKNSLQIFDQTPMTEVAYSHIAKIYEYKNVVGI